MIDRPDGDAAASGESNGKDEQHGATTHRIIVAARRAGVITKGACGGTRPYRRPAGGPAILAAFPLLREAQQMIVVGPGRGPIDDVLDEAELRRMMAEPPPAPSA
jgi:hypothetical protein